MSRIGKRPIELPSRSTWRSPLARVQVNGPLGELSQVVPQRMKIEQAEGELLVTRPTERGEDRALHGLTRTLIANMVEGVTKGFEKHLEIQGVGYRAALRGTDLELNVGYSHSVVIKPRPGITFEVPAPTQVIVKGTDKQAGRPDGRRGAPGAPAGALQGQGNPLSGTSTSAGRSGRGHEHADTRQARERRHRRIRGKVAGTAERPRLAVFRSNKGIFAQLIDDESGRRSPARAGSASRSRSRATGSSRPARWARRSPTPPRRPGSRPSCSIAAATCTTDASRRSPRARVRED